jgi:hypothetical protein
MTTRTAINAILMLVAAWLVGAGPADAAGDDASLPWVDVRDFAPPEAKADGGFDWNSKEHPYLQDAIDSITHFEEYGPDWHFAHGTVIFPAGTFKTTTPVRLPGGIRLVGAGARSTILLGQHRGVAVVTMKGASKCSLENLQIQADGPQTGLLLARVLVPNNSVPSGKAPNPGGHHRFFNVDVTGVATKALVYSIASEVNLWDQCAFRLDETAPALHVFYTSRRDDLEIDNLPDCVNTVHTFVSCTFVNARGPVGDDHEQVDSLYINTAGIQYALFLNCYFVTGAGCWVRIGVETHEGEDASRGPIHFIGCGNELYGSAPGGGKVQAGVILSAPRKNNPTYSGLTFENSSFSFQAQPAVRVADPMTLDNFRYNHMSSSGGNGGLQLSSLVNSEIRLVNGKAVIAGDARNNVFAGPAGSFRIEGDDRGNVFRDTGNDSMHGSRRTVLTCTEDTLIEPHLSGAMVSNRGATGPVTFTLPAASPGLHYALVNTAGRSLMVAAAGVDVIALGAERRMRMASEAAVSALTVVAESEGLWIVTGRTGDWKGTE